MTMTILMTTIAIMIIMVPSINYNKRIWFRNAGEKSNQSQSSLFQIFYGDAKTCSRTTVCSLLFVYSFAGMSRTAVSVIRCVEWTSS